MTISGKDDAVRERHGAACRNDAGKASSVTVWEGNEFIYLSGTPDIRKMTAWQARYLASKLYRLSRRIRARNEP